MNDPFANLTKAINKARKGQSYRVETVSLEFTEALLARMKACGVNRAELARRTGTSAPYISKLLNNTGNLTVDSLVKIADAVGCDLRTHLVPRDCDGMWINVIKERPANSTETLTAADSNEFALAA